MAHQNHLKPVEGDNGRESADGVSPTISVITKVVLGFGSVCVVLFMIQFRSCRNLGNCACIGESCAVYVSQSWGSLRCNLTTVGSPLVIGGKSYIHGFGTHANSLLRFHVPKNAVQFSTAVGLPDYAKNTPASVQFELRGNGRFIWHSPIIRGGEMSQVTASVKGISILELLVNDAGDGYDGDHACWIDPVFK